MKPTGKPDTIDPAPTGPGLLKKVIGPWQFFALAFGSIIGSGWLIVLGDWLHAAGPGGAMLAFLCGGLAIMIIGACYGELAARMPSAGGEVVYGREIFGPRVSFFLGWFIALYYISLCAYEAIAVSLLIEMLAPGALGPVLYKLAGYEVRGGSIAVGLVAALTIAALNYRGVKSAVVFQTLMTFTFLAMIAAIFGLSGARGDVANLAPLFAGKGGSPWWIGALWIFATCPFWLTGFQVVPQAVEERRPDLGMGRIAGLMVLAILVATGFYVAVIGSMSLAAPWRSLIAVPMAAVAAVDHLAPGGWLTKALLFAALLSLFKTWNGSFLAGARLLMAQGRERFIPDLFARIHPRFGSPYAGVAAITVLTCLAVPLGKGAVLPIIDTAAISMGFVYVVVCLAVLKLRARGPAPAGTYKVWGGKPTIWLGLLSAAGMAAFAMIEPWGRRNGALPLEWMLLIAWIVAGWAFWTFIGRRGGAAVTAPAPAE